MPGHDKCQLRLALATALYILPVCCIKDRCPCYETPYPRQAEVLELIKANMNETGMPPTRAEIAQKLGFKSANAAEEHLKALAKRGS